MVMGLKKKVLIVGSNHGLNKISEKMFKRGGYEIITCSNENEARKIRFSEGDAIDCVFYPKNYNSVKKKKKKENSLENFS
ncbi:hypothetical protein LCGC14_0457250 [marine sediment metagenome]|uniref:Uncharacterized protein n=1 Tax=marine sediment metagenome TaxID=412755 RepID=A0A0F9SG42_9ZZZZ